MASPAKVGICTDSHAQMPDALVERFEVEVVPITVRVDDHEYLENVDLDADAFYAMFTDDHTPTVSTSRPSPGQFALAYEDLVARGCTEILSIHVTSSVSGTLNSARLAARSLEVPVRLVDSGTASFGVACCVWAAADALVAGASLDEAATVAEALVPSIGNVFFVDGLPRARRGRAHGADRGSGSATGLPILTLRDGHVDVITRVPTVVDAINTMAATAIGWGERVKAAVGVADSAAMPIADALAHAVGEAATVDEVVRYRVGPSIGVHTGRGTVGCFMFPTRP